MTTTPPRTGMRQVRRLLGLFEVVRLHAAVELSDASIGVGLVVDDRLRLVERGQDFAGLIDHVNPSAVVPVPQRRAHVVLVWVVLL